MEKIKKIVVKAQPDISSDEPGRQIVGLLLPKRVQMERLNMHGDYIGASVTMTDTDASDLFAGLFERLVPEMSEDQVVGLLCRVVNALILVSLPDEDGAEPGERCGGLPNVLNGVVNVLKAIRVSRVDNLVGFNGPLKNGLLDELSDLN